METQVAKPPTTPKLETRKSEPNPTLQTTGIKDATPEMIDIADDDDIEMIVFGTPRTSGIGTSASNAISVEGYANDRDLELAIWASLNNPGRIIDLDDYDFDDDLQFLGSSPPPSSFSGKRPIREKGESSSSSASRMKPRIPKLFMCEICTDTKPESDSFKMKGCAHSYCSDCMIKYVASKLQDNITGIGCPAIGCNVVLEPEHCRSIMPPEVFERWGSALCEQVILASQKFYCPYKDCSALLIKDEGGPVILESECPNCWRLFCAQCEVPWHSGIECAEFQKLNKDEREREDIQLMKLAKNKSWRRCPKCKIYVERIDGCLYMLCRCKHAFCYNCGAPMGNNHFCQKCKH